MAMALDGVFVAASKSLLSIVSDLKALGIPEEKIITYDKLSIPYFTFGSMQNLVGFWISHIRRTA